MTDEEMATEAMPQSVEMYKHYEDEESFARDRDALGNLGWRVESARTLQAHRSLLGHLRHRHGSPIDTHYVRPTWPDSWQ